MNDDCGYICMGNRHNIMLTYQKYKEDEYKL